MGDSVAHEVVVCGLRILSFANDMFAIDSEIDSFELVGNVLQTCVAQKSN